MRSPLEYPAAGRVDSTARAQRGARWLWWSLLVAGGVLLVVVFASVLMRGNEGVRNRGPADEAAPGAEPSRDIDRSRSR
jgi:hypothetical protein